MLVSYLRSSSIGTWELCRHAHMIEYVMGLKADPNIKTERGSVVHKALELLARRKFSEQQGLTSFRDEETERDYPIEQITTDFAVDEAFEHYAYRKNSPNKWTEEDRDICRKLTHHTVDFRGGMFDPRKRHVIQPEQYFDLTIDEPWAKYKYKDPHTGEEVKGTLAIKGTIDLVTEVAPGIMEYCDWKTGRRWNWACDKEKVYEHMCHDPQLLLYYYALTRLYPEYKTIFVTIFFIADGGPYTVAFDRSHVAEALWMLRRKFEDMKNTQKPKLIIYDKAKAWKCRSFCYHGRNNWPGTDKTICKFVEQEVVQLGVERTIAKHGKPGAAFKYGSGGGKENRE